jgi:hypothetical protein
MEEAMVDDKQTPEAEEEQKDTNAFDELKDVNRTRAEKMQEFWKSLGGNITDRHKVLSALGKAGGGAKEVANDYLSALEQVHERSKKALEKKLKELEKEYKPQYKVWGLTWGSKSKPKQKKKYFHPNGRIAGAHPSGLWIDELKSQYDFTPEDLSFENLIEVYREQVSNPELMWWETTIWSSKRRSTPLKKQSEDITKKRKAAVHKEDTKADRKEETSRKRAATREANKKEKEAAKKAK